MKTPTLDQLSAWKLSVDSALAQFEDDLASVRDADSEDEGLARWLTAYFKCWLAIAAANETFGAGITVRQVRAIAKKGWPEREFDISEERARRTAVAYKSGLRLTSAGAKDTPIEAAMQFAAAMEGLSSDWASETIRKSISRLRARLRGEYVLRLDPHTLEVTALDAEAALIPHLPGRRGRPKAASSN